MVGATTADGGQGGRPTEGRPEAASAGCQHHWVIEPPNGRTSRGVCRDCKQTRDFRNSLDYTTWYGTRGSK